MTYSELSRDVKFLITGSGTGTTDYAAADILANINEYYNEVVSLILSADGKWEWDDNNQTTLPVSTTNLVSGQADYEISGSTFLDLLRVEMKDENGNGVQLEPISYEDRNGTAMTEWAKTNATPQYYDKVGNSIILYPTPNYNSTAGLKTYYQRPPSYFVVSDTTKTPGFNPLFHRYLSIGAAIDYCSVNSMNDRLSFLIPKLTQMKKDIISAYSTRSKDVKISLKMANGEYGDYGDYKSENIV